MVVYLIYHGSKLKREYWWETDETSEVQAIKARSNGLL
jgi:hypothetical protein